MPGKKPTPRAYSWKPRGDYSSLAFTPPYPPGESSYTIKGMGYRSFLEDCDTPSLRRGAPQSEHGVRRDVATQEGVNRGEREAAEHPLCVE
jgi:hypothetical protein